MLAGVVIGIGLSLLWLISVATRPHMPLLGREPGTQVFRDLDEHPDDEQSPESSCSGSTAACSSPPPTRWRTGSASSSTTTPDLTGIVLDCEGINFVDSQGAAKLDDDRRPRRATPAITLRLARLKPPSGRPSNATACSTRIGADHVHGNVHRAVQAQLDSPSTPPEEPGT